MSDLDNLKDKYDKKETKASSNVKNAKALTKELEAKKDSAPVRAVKQAVSGFRSQWSGIDDQGKVGVGKGVPGIYYDTVAIPALAGVVDDKYAPEFAVEADKKAGRIKEAVRKDMGIDAPKGALEHFANAGGTMLAQLPVPGAWLGRVLSPVKSAGIAGKVATSPIEYLSPIVDPKKINYGVGTGFGGTIGTVGEMLEEEPTKKELGGLIQKYETGGRVGKAKAFFSAVDKAIETLKQKKGTGEQILKEIEKAPGVKKEELELRKIPEKLKSKKSITQEEVKALAAESPAPGIKPIVLGGGVDPNWQPKLTDKQKELLDIAGIEPVVNPEDPRMLGFLIRETGDIIDQATLKTMTPADFGIDDTRVKELAAAREAGTITPEQLDEIRRLQRDDILLNTKILASEIQNQFLMDQRPAKFEKYTTPGGENYREVLLQLDNPVGKPRDSLGGAPREVSREEAADYLGLHPDMIGEESQILIYPNGAYIERLPDGEYYGMAYNEDKVSASLEDIEEFLASRLDSDMLAPGAPDFRSAHFEDPNVLVHARVTDRTGPNGEKVLYVEEIQSDWHQAGRNKGYQDPVERAEVAKQIKDLGIEKPIDNVSIADLERAGAPEELVNRFDTSILKTSRAVPDAPFKKTSHELAMKQILDMAAKEGYDKVAIAPGSEQIKRYNMSKELDAIRALRDDRGLITLSGLKNSKSGNMSTDTVVIEKLGIDPKDLPEYIGKEKAEQILAGLGEDNIFELRGKDLEMTSKEGLGKKKIYDEIIPNYLGKYVKKEFGVDPGEVDISFGQPAAKAGDYERRIERMMDEIAGEESDELMSRTMDVNRQMAEDALADVGILRADLDEDQFEDQIWNVLDEFADRAREQAARDMAVERIKQAEPGALKAFAVDVTPQMREKITGEGQKLFAAAPVVGVQAVPEAPQPEAAPQAEPEEEPQAFQRGGRAEDDEKSAARLIEEEPFVQSVLNAARHYQGGKEIESGQAGIRKGPVTVGVNAANIRDPGARDAMQAQALFAAYRDRLGNVDVNASVNKPAQAPQGFYQGNVMASMPVGEGRVMGGVSGYKTPEKSDISGYNFGYEQKVGPGYASGMVFKPKDGRQDTRYDIQYNIPFQSGGRVGLAKKAIEAAMKKAGQKSGQVAEKDLTNIQDFQTSLNDRIAEKVREKKKLMDSFDFTYKPGDRVFTEWSAGNNYPPFEILDKATTQKRYARDPNTSKILRDAEGNKVEIQPEAGYLVRHKFNFNGEDVDHQYVIPEKNIKGVVEPDEPYKRGGPVGFQSGGRVGMARAAAEKLMRVLHGSPSSITPEPGKAIDVTTESGYAVKRGADKMLGKSGPPMVNKFDIPESRLLKFEEQYSPEDVALMKRFFNKLPEGQTMRGDEIWDAAQGRDVIMEGIAKAGGFAGYERPNTGAVGKGQWFRITEPDELKRGKKAGGLAQASKKL